MKTISTDIDELDKIRQVFLSSLQYYKQSNKKIDKSKIIIDLVIA